MAHMAELHCDTVILTDEDPYDEDPQSIVDEMAQGMTLKKPIIIMDRKKAIAHAISIAQPGDAILLTGKGTDPSICRAAGEQELWNEFETAQKLVRAHMKKAHE
jgi:UDP-N-acetylmuramoyl-L-alanyl-D-glutamate--2,6-diaminopimelate ligase